MNSYVALLGAINVGSHTVKMERLRELFMELDYVNVCTFIQTGNVFFDTAETDLELIARNIESHLRTALGYEVPTCVMTLKEIEVALNADPFEGVEITEDVRLCLVFLSQPLSQATVFPVVSCNKDIEVISSKGRVANVVAHHFLGKAANPKAFIEKEWSIKATVRFFHTVEKLVAATRI